MIVGEAPGEKEDNIGKPFVGPSGMVLAKALQHLPDTAGVRITNSVRCRPPNNRTPTVKQLNTCRVHLVQEIQRVKPKVIVPLGNAALRSVLGEVGISKCRGKVFDSAEFGCKVVPAYHPSYLLRNQSPDIEKEFRQDIELAYAVSQGKVTKETVNVPDVVVVNDILKLKKLEKALLSSKRFAVDIEATTMKPQQDYAKILCVGFAYDKVGYVVPYLHDNAPNTREWRKAVKTFLTTVLSSPVPKVAHNWFYDYGYLKHFGFKTRNAKYDTLLASYLLNELPGNHALDIVARRFTDYSDWSSELEDYFASLPKHNERGEPKSYGDIPGDRLFPYCGRDAVVTLKALPVLLGKLKKETRVYRKLCYRVYRTKPDSGSRLKTLRLLTKTLIGLSEMSLSGWRVDTKHLQELESRYPAMLRKKERAIASDDRVRRAVAALQRARREKRVSKYLEDGMERSKAKLRAKKDYPLNAPFNVKSAEHKRVLFFDVLGFEPSAMTDTGLAATDKKSIQGISDPLVLKVQDVTQIRDLISKYIHPMLNDTDKHRYVCDDGKIHPSYNLMAVTGRTRSDDPNGHNIPEHTTYAKDIKRMVKSRFKDGVLIGTDYGQQELRVLAAFTGEPALVNAFKQGEDPHLQAAFEIYSDKAIRRIPMFKGAIDDLKKNGKKSTFRDRIKTIGFGILYGKSAYGLCAEFGLNPDNEDDLKTAELILETFFKKRPLVKKYIDRSHAFVKKYSCVVTPPPFSRIRRLPEARSSDKDKVSAALRESVNAPIQGAASDIMLAAKNDMDVAIRKHKAKVVVWNVIHDALYLDVHPEYKEWALETVKSVMEGQTKRFKWLGDVPLLAEPKLGKYWSDL